MKARPFRRALALLALLAATGPAAQPEAPRAILVLSGERPELPPVMDFERGLREGLADPRGATEFFVEYLDFGRFPRPQYEKEALRHLRARYDGRKIGVVVTVFDTALGFVLAQPDALPSGVPLVVAGVEQRDLARRSLPPGAATVPLAYDYRRTLGLVLALQPAVKEIVVVHGTSEFDLRRRDEARAALEEQKLPFRLLGGLPLAEIEAGVRALPPDTAVLFLSMVRDAEGRSLVGQDYAGRVARASPVPVYSMDAGHLRRGALGGAITDYAELGRSTAVAVARRLAGEQVSGPRTIEAPVSPLRINWQALQKWNLPPGRLPREAEILMREPGLWDEYRPLVVGAIIAVLLQALLISGLLLQLRQRQHAEAELRRAMDEAVRKQQQLEHISRFSTMGEIAASLAHELSQPLGAILANAQAGLRFLERGKLDEAEMRDILQEVVADDRRAGEVVGALRSMLRRERAESARLDVAQLAQEVLLLLRGELVAQHIEVEVDCRADCFVLANKTQVEQVLLNLLMNAVDAMRARSAGERRLRIQVSRDGDEVHIAVRDSGIGIPAEEQGKVFEPFWTTKASGMGMGLSIASSILRSFGGSIRIEQNDGPGVTFRCTLPLAPAAVQNPAQP